jgi:phage terminase large subunit
VAKLQIEIPPAFEPLLADGVRYRGAYGGRGSGKSWFFARLLIAWCMRYPGARVLCVREIQRSLKQSVKRLLEDEIQRLGLGDQFEVMEDKIMTPGGGWILFEGMQNHTAESIKSLEGLRVAWVEEAQVLSERSLTLLRPTIRAPGSELWFSWNPRYKTDPVDALLRGEKKLPDAVIVKATYEDNPWFPEELRGDMEWDRARDPEKYAHVWLGEYELHSEARVFKNWVVAEDEFEAPVGTTFYFGADWGFSVDPTVLVRCWIDGRKLYVDREVYRIGCEIEDTPALFDTLENGQAKRWVITADSARPETISHMRRHGYPKITPARKGAGSLEEGVTFLQSYDIIVHPRCKHTIDELTLYRYKTDPLTEQVLPVLEDKKNHVIDSLHYAIEQARKSIVREVRIPDLTKQSEWVLPVYALPQENEDAPPVKRRSQWSYDR